MATAHQYERLGRCMLAVIALAGCEPEETAAAFSPQVQDASATTDTILSSDASVTASLTGTWVLATDWSTCVEIPDLPTELRTYKLVRVKMVQDNLRLTETREVCSVTNTALLGQVTVFPDPLIATFAVQTVTSTLFGSGVGAGYAAGWDQQILGAQFGDPLAEPMPTSAADPRVVDQEKDGNPGATLEVGKLCKAYVVSRALSALSGTVVGAGRIEGRGWHETSQAFLGGSSAFCSQAFPTPANQASSFFVMQRVDKDGLGWDSDGDGDVSCAEIRAGFAAQPVVSWLTADNQRCTPPSSP